jgi:hypothetical protein
MVLQDGAASRGGDRFFKDANKYDWAFVAACLAAAIVCGVSGVKLAIAHYKAQHSASSSHRPAK